MALLRSKKILLPALFAGLLLAASPYQTVQGRSGKSSSNQWRPLTKIATPNASIQKSITNSGSTNSLPTINNPVSAPSRQTSRSLDWYDLGNGAKIRVLSTKNASKLTTKTLESLTDDNLIPRESNFQLAQTPGATAAAPNAHPAGTPSPITGAQSQSLMAPTTIKQGNGTNQTSEMNLGSVLKLPAGMNQHISSLELRELDLKDALRGLAAMAGINIMIQNEVNGTITLSFNNVYLEEAFNTLIKSQNLAFAWEGSILRIFTAASAPVVSAVFNIQNTRAEDIKPMVDRFLTVTRGSSEVDTRTNSLVVNDTQDKIDRIRGLIPQLDVQQSQVEVTIRKITEVFYLNYVDATNLIPALETITARTNILAYSSNQAAMSGAAGATGGATGRQDMLIITDIPANLEKIRELVEKLDIAPIQVTIDAHIYEIDLNEEERLGINWQKQIPIAGSTEKLLDISISPEDATAGGTGVFRFGSLTINQFTALLAMLKTHTFAKVLSNPVITTLNNRQANITVGQAIPYVSASTVNATTGQVSNTISQANANITLLVTPSVTGNEEVFLDIAPTISSVLGFTSLGGNSTPNLSQRSALTQVIVKNNHTIVIGGMIKTDKSDSITKVPFLGDLPGIGKFFQKKTQKESRTELIIFITPHIVRSHVNQKVGTVQAKSDTDAIQPRVSLQP